MSRSLTDEYGDILIAAIDRIRRTQGDKLRQGAALVRNVLVRDGLIYVFGCGHSHMLAEEAFYRAGGLACVSPVFCESLMLHESASESSRLEKQSGQAEAILDGCGITDRDMLICVSTSGVNGVPVETAAAAAGRGICTIGIASDAYLDMPACSAGGQHLQQVCQLCFDNCAPVGDACLQPDGLPVRMTPVSTVTGTFILNSLLAEAVRLALEQGFTPPVYLSGNIPGGSEYNSDLIRRYKSRIRFL